MKESTDIPVSFKFPKNERLHSKKLIDALFNQGASFHLYPFSVRCMPNPDPDADCHQMMATVPKKRFKKAVDRNRVKRLIKESYRLQKHQLVSPPETQKYWLIAYIYIAREIHDYPFIKNKLKDSLGRLNKRMTKEVSS